MLRLKQAMNECGVQQKSFVEFSNWSKTQVSLTLSTGKLPADKARFCDSVVRFVDKNPPLLAWLDEQGLSAESLLETVTAGGQSEQEDREKLHGLEILDIEINALVGGWHVDNSLTANDLNRLARCAKFLARQLNYYGGLLAPSIMADAVTILTPRASSLISHLSTATERS